MSNMVEKFKKTFLKEEFSVQHKLMNVTLIALVLFNIVEIIFTVITQPKNYIGCVTILSTLLMSIFCSCIANKLKKEKLAAILLTISVDLILLPLVFFNCGGLFSGMPMWFVLGLMMIPLILKGTPCVILFTLTLIIDIFCIVLAYLHPEFTTTFTNPVHQLLDIIISLLLTSGLVAFILWVQGLLLKQQQEIVEKSIEQAENATKAKSTFLSNISHDIRTPMNAIVGFTNIAQRDPTNATKIKNCLDKINISSSFLLNLINNILDMSKIENGALTIENSQVDLIILLDEITQILQFDLDSKNIKLEVDISQIRHTTVYSDKLKIKQILINILSNSIKYSKEDTQIVLSIKENSGPRSRIANYEFTIKDETTGFTENALNSLFTPENSDDRNSGSSGLGLAITKNLVEIMDGNISVKKGPNNGSIFTILLQFYTIEKQFKFPVKENLKYNFEGRRVLLVEDNEINLEIASTMLEDSNINFETAKNGKVAVQKVLEAPANYYDLILMDIVMPVMDGYTAIEQIRNSKNKNVANIPIIAMTANAFEEDKQKAYALGVNNYLSKPISFDSFLNILEMYLT